MKLKLFVITILILFCASSFAQAPSWEWVKRSYGSKINVHADGYGNEANSIAADSSGNVYAVGYYLSSNIIFDNDTLYNLSTDISNNDIFIVKYDKDGNVLWARSIGGKGDDEPTSVASDINGNVYIAGYFNSDTIVFGNDTIVNKNNHGKVLLCKYDANGNSQWARISNGTSDDQATSVTVDNAGNVYITGNFISPKICFDSDTLTNIGSLDIFLVKYTANGKVIWAKSFGGIGQDDSYSISEKNGNVFIGGDFKGSYIAFGNDTLFNNSMSGYSDFFLVKLDSTGNVHWARSAGGPSDERIYAINTDKFGNILVTGVFFSNTFMLDTIKLMVTSVISDDFFVAKYSTEGQVLWAKSGGGNNDDASSSIVSDGLGDAIVTICYNSPSIVIGADTLHNAGLYDGVIAEYDMNGNMQWTKNIGGSTDDGAYSATVNSLGNIFVAGFYQSPTIIFDAFTLTRDQTSGFSTAYVAKLEDVILGVNNIDKTNSIYVYPNPCNGLLTVSNTNINNDAVLSVYNIFGENIFIKKNPSTSEHIDLSAYSKGVYFVKITSAKTTEVVKIIKE